jgi:hypothetical protein
MTLRPRYSLLTLLLLTTAIAVGVKLWRGPHRTLYQYPFTSAEQRESRVTWGSNTPLIPSINWRKCRFAMVGPNGSFG